MCNYSPVKMYLWLYIVLYFEPVISVINVYNFIDTYIIIW